VNGFLILLALTFVDDGVGVESVGLSVCARSRVFGDRHLGDFPAGTAPAAGRTREPVGFSAVREQRENIEGHHPDGGAVAEVKIGALIAIEQTIQLQETVESEILVDCEATPDNVGDDIFPNNAIHDGGVIIKGDRIAQAACIFR